jgi:4-hydroxybenzoyl-CoA reductase alpha subunit
MNERKVKGYWLRKRQVEAEELSVVGKSFPRIDSKIKVTGEARYAGDFKFPGMLYGKILRSPHAHAKILNIDTSKAKKLPGVKAVVTGKDTLGVKYGLWRLRPETMDEQGLAMDKVRYIGDEVAAVAAIDEDTAEEALGLISVEYEPLQGLFTPEEAMKEGAPEIHEGIKNNVSVTRLIEVGDVDKAWAQCDCIREDTFRTQVVAHAAMEPHTCVAIFDPTGKLTIWTSTQSPYFVQCLLAMALGMREGDIRVIRPNVGGGFGGKLELFGNEFCSSLLSKITGRPVRIEYTREEVFVTTRQKFSMIMEMKTGVKKNGEIVAVEFKNILDGGAHHSYGVTTTMIAGICLPLPYRIPNYRYSGRHVYTNKPVTGAMRGHGAMQPAFAFDSLLDLIAEEIGVDPLELRLKNATQPGDIKIPNVCHISSCGLRECIEKVGQSMKWKKKYGKLPEGRGLGIGIYGFFSGALYNYFNTDRPYNEAWVRVNSDGTVHYFTLAAEIGQGCDTILSQIVAEEVGARLEDVTIISGDTGIVTGDTGAFSSRTTMMAGNAAKQAAADAKRQLFSAAAHLLGLKLQDELEAKNGRIYVKRTNRGVSLAETARAFQAANNGAPVLGRGVYTPTTPISEGTVVSPTWSFGAQIVEVEVDKETGQVKVVDSATAHDCGRAINPMSVEGQLEGSMHMALGYALSEEVKFENGKVLNPSFLDYKMFSALDMPKVDSIVVETDDPHGPFGAKESGEGLTIPTAPAIANAIYDAVGVSIKELPITPEKVLKGLQEKSKSKK